MTTDHPDRRLRLPQPPSAPPPRSRAELPVWPAFPASRPARRRTDPRPRVALVAMLAAMVGVLAGTGMTVVLLTQNSEETPAAAPPPAQPAPTVQVEGEVAEDRVSGVAAAVLPSVVQIDIEGGGFGGAAGNGSGVIYRSDGHIVTNNHVIAEANDIEVVLADGVRLRGTVVGSDPLNDLAVVRVDRDDLPEIQVGDSSELTVGELAVAVGSPFGLEGSVTAGVISTAGRTINLRGPEGEPLTLPNVIQTDAPINPGNSGGALVDGEGRLIGINSAILTAGGGPPANAGVGFAIPANTVVDITEELIANGVVQHPFLGVQGRDMTTELGSRLGVDDGAYVESVQGGTPAAEAGVESEDVITALDGEEISSMEDLIVAIRNRDVGERVSIELVRDREPMSVDVTLVERPDDPS